MIIGSMNLKKMKLRLLALLIIQSAILAVVSGCGGAKTLQESVIVRDTVIVTKERTLTDTLLLYKDTVIIQNGVKVKLEYVDRLVKVTADCPPDTVRVWQTKYVQKIDNSQKEKNSFIKDAYNILMIIFALSLIALLIRFVR